MLKTLDILIGATTILLIFSMAVTVITQASTALLNSKGKHLKAGLTDLLQQLGIADIKIAQTISEKLLTHPMIAVGGRLGSVIHRDEFTKLLLDLSSGQGAATLKDDAKNALQDTLKRNGIPDSAEALKNIRDMALRLEASNPEIANHVRDGLAVLHGAPSDFVARVHSWFDQSIDRVSERFTQYTHGVVLAISVAVVLVVQLDIIAVVERLSIDDQFRNTLVAHAVKDFSEKVTDSGHAESGTAVQPAGTPVGASGATANQPSKSPAGTPVASPGTGAQAPQPASVQTPNSESKADAKAVQDASLDPKPYYDLLNKAGLITITFPFSGNWSQQIQEKRKWPGMLLSVLLLSLGAPFWYNALKGLLRLRSTIAGKDDAEREQRQSTKAPGDGSVAASTGPTATLLAGETGDLGAVG